MDAWMDKQKGQSSTTLDLDRDPTHRSMKILYTDDKFPEYNVEVQILVKTSKNRRKNKLIHRNCD